MTSRLKRCHFINRALVRVTAALKTTTKTAKHRKTPSRTTYWQRKQLIQTAPFISFCWESSQCSHECLCIWVERTKFAHTVRSLEGEVHNWICSQQASFSRAERQKREQSWRKLKLEAWAIALRVQICGIYRAIIDLWIGHCLETKNGCLQNSSYRLVTLYSQLVKYRGL